MHQEHSDSHTSITKVIAMPIEGHLRGTNEKNAIATHCIVRLGKESNLASSTNKTPSIGEVLL
jgi:hypothetical protein